jgi:hypothetical protein
MHHRAPQLRTYAGRDARAVSVDRRRGLQRGGRGGAREQPAFRISTSLSSDPIIIIKEHQREIWISQRQTQAARLLPGEWLVDELINFYFCLLEERDKRLCLEGSPASHFFNSFFFAKLLGDSARDYDFAAVERWTMRFDLFSRRFMFAPVNIGNMHWCLVVVDFLAKDIRYYDSLGGGPLF